MDVIVKWKDGSKNCVSTNELVTVNNNDAIKLGTSVKMLYGKNGIMAKLL